MSATPSRRRAPRALLAGLLSLALLAGCTRTQRDATDYDGTRKHFLEGCIARAKDDNDAKDAEVQIASPATWCECVFKAIEKDIDFDRFSKVNSDLRENGGALPKDIQKAYDSCDPETTADS